MKSIMQKSMVALAFAGLLTLAVPAAAQAATIYPPSDSITATSTVVAPGGAVTFSFADGMFSPGETVTFTLTGEGASQASLAMMIKTAVQTNTLGTGIALADGSVADKTIRLHAGAVGTYTLAAYSPTAGGTITVTVGTLAAEGDTLPQTGTDSAMLLGLWVAGGAILLAGAAIVIVASVRRQRNQVVAR